MKIRSATISTLQRLVFAVALCFLFGYMMGASHSMLPSDNKALPVFFMAVFAVPVTAMIACISKIGDVNKMSGLSASERRRLIPYLQERRRSMFMMTAIQCTLSVFSGLALFLAAHPSIQPFAVWIYRGIGASIAFAIVVLVFSLMDLGKLNDFEALIVSRVNKRKNNSTLLKKMSNGNE